jgi:hypothetical protein
VCFAALWRPGVTVCSTCVRGNVFAVPAGSDEDHRCDRCRTVFAQGVHPATCQVGNFVVLYGVCDGCMTRLGEPT